MFASGVIPMGVLGVCFLSPVVYWMRSCPEVQAVAVALHSDQRFHQFVGGIAVPTTLLSLLAIATLFDLPLTAGVPTALLGEILLVALPLTAVVLTVYLHVEFFAAVAVFRRLPDDMFGTLPGTGASRYQSWMYLVDAHHDDAPLAGPGAILALLATAGELFAVLSPLTGVLVALTLHVTVLAFVMGADNGTLHRTNDERVQSRIDTGVAERNAGRLFANDRGS
ncbi:hypothetical protein M0R89_01725 [Halorussus limi]|uniref:Uncharacterized protein n=1 Tax=Halorussus limi TaxID=2938695 RepID=A0A8U0HUQ4_9EURY|nr:hypothetical protein [Halorussus limi]UPV74802.1 hypothetical protein M0R89_01725 [Halorussus limi]